MKKISEKIIEEINSKRIKPISKFSFRIKNIATWFLAIISISLGILSIALISYNLTSHDWDLYRQLGNTPLGYALSSLPFFWLGLTIIFLFIGIFNFEHTKKGYKYSPLHIALFSLAITLIVGITIYAKGGGQALDNYLGEKFIGYQTVEYQKEQTWSQPSAGLFSGTIINVSDRNFALKDFSGKTWSVDFSEARIRENVTIKAGNQVKIIGHADESTIKASDIRPWSPGGGRGYHRSQR